MNDDDELLDKIIAHFRSEAAPEMPAGLAVQRTVVSRRWMAYAVAASVSCATVFGYIWMHSRVPELTEPPGSLMAAGRPPEMIESGVVVKPVDLTAPLTELDARLASIDAQIEELSKQAALLDARRRADKMLAQY